MDHQRWEYKSVTLMETRAGGWIVNHEDGMLADDGTVARPLDAAFKHIQALGQQGWELVTSYSTTPREGMYPTRPTLLFKRPLMADR